MHIAKRGGDAAANGANDHDEPLCKFKLGSLDDDALMIVAQYNPGSIQYERAVPWADHPRKQIEYTGPQGRALTVELLFDGVEERRSVQPMCDVLEQMSLPIDMTSSYARERRPHFCVATWGESGMPKLTCVIESLVVKYMYWSPSGRPMRAMCTVKLKEADVLSSEAQANRDTARIYRAVSAFVRKR